MASSEKNKGKLKEIRIKFHHSPDGENDGFSVKHHFEDRMNNDFMGPEEDHGSFTHHGKLMGHLHEHLKDHGSEEPEENEDGCAMCDDVGDKEAKEEVGKHNMTKHGYEKHTPNAPGHASHNSKHPGFKSVENKIAAKEGLSHKAAGAILAARSRGASAGAHKANPRLNRVKG